MSVSPQAQIRSQEVQKTIQESKIYLDAYFVIKRMHINVSVYYNEVLSRIY